MTSADLEDGLPREFDGYRLIRLLGRGGMGRVYLAHDTLLDRQVAIKFLSVADADADVRQRFIVEARAVARLQHPCVVAVHRVGEAAGHPYLVSEYVAGEGLDRLELPLPWERALRIAYDLARGLSTAHRFGVVHRDVKPSNAILAPDGTVKLLDFGIARLLDPLRAAVDAEERPERVASPPEGRDGAAEVDLPTATAATRDGTVRLTGSVEPEGAAEEQDQRLTRPGSVLGTPAYMAPEVWLGTEATFASDVYSLGALVYALCTGHPPHEGQTLAEIRQRALGADAVPLAEAASTVDPGLAAVVDRCLRRNPSERYSSANEVRAALLRVLEPRRELEPEGNPYRGLRPFEAQHRAVFFGRDSETRAVLEKLAAEPLVVVTGDSGVGKSSLCRAGVLPRVGEWLEPARRWTATTIVPGRHPAEALCVAMAAALDLREETLREALADGPESFVRELRRALGRDRGVVLFLDQLEELVTLGDAEGTAATAGLLRRLAEPTPGLRALASVRADFLGRLAALPALAEPLPRALYFVRPLSAERVREAIVGPAEAKGFAFETGAMVEELVTTTVRSEGGLPLLAFALERLWEARDAGRQVIPAAALAALGGVAGALSIHADDVLARLRPRQRERARRMLLRLVAPDGTRIRCRPEELVGGEPDDDAVLDALVRGRLVVGRETAEGSAGYEVAHEALVRAWGTLAGWLTADADRRAIRERLGRARAEWERLGGARDALWTARQLAEAAALRDADLSPGEVAFRRASRRGVRRSRRLRWTAAAVAVLALAGTWAAVRLNAAHQLAARVDAKLAAGLADLAEARVAETELGRLEKSSFALFDARRPEEAEAAWVAVLAARKRLVETLARAAGDLEPAAALDPGRADVRSAFADTLYERARRAELSGDGAAVRELLLRLALYDDDGSRRRRWAAPARLAVRSTPPGAGIAVERYVDDGTGRVAPQPAGISGRTPVAFAGLAPGSYRLRLQAPGYADVSFPLTLERDGNLEVDVALLPAADIPPGFTYVPAGRFLFGSADEDSLRRGFLHAVPIHAVDTGGYLIARHETTFAEWIEYLRASPPEVRAVRAPAVQAGGFQGALTLRELPDGRWELSYRPAERTYTVRSGERLRYEDRARRVEQDWLRFPVVGVTAADAEDYARWLGESGRVPRARLCSEWEWERGARGGDDRVFPHGRTLSPDDADYDLTYGKRPAAMGPDEVGSHPASRSPFELDDMAGNVWEWTVSSVEPQGHAARGGSFYFDVNSARVANRETPEPSFRDVSVGFRICADVAQR